MNGSGEPQVNLGSIHRVGVIVAHPDDEILWAGGLLLSRPQGSTFIMTLCRAGDSDRAPRFRRSLDVLGAQGEMGDLDDGPDQTPLPARLTRDAILSLLPGNDFDLLLTHGPEGEYSRHRRHEEVSRAVRDLLRSGDLRAGSLWQFAYEDGGGAYLPRPRGEAQVRLPLAEELWARKYDLITNVYGFAPSSWEAKAAPRTEAFCTFSEIDWKAP